MSKLDNDANFNHNLKLIKDFLKAHYFLEYKIIDIYI